MSDPVGNSLPENIGADHGEERGCEIPLTCLSWAALFGDKVVTDFLALSYFDPARIVSVDGFVEGLRR